jgi:hypothetical protein
VKLSARRDSTKPRRRYHWWAVVEICSEESEPTPGVLAPPQALGNERPRVAAAPKVWMAGQSFSLSNAALRVKIEIHSCCDLRTFEHNEACHFRPAGVEVNAIGELGVDVDR